MAGRMVSADEARRVQRTPYYTDAPDRTDLAHTVVELTAQLDAVRALHCRLDDECDWCSVIANRSIKYPCKTARLLGVSDDRA